MASDISTHFMAFISTKPDIGPMSIATLLTNALIPVSESTLNFINTLRNETFTHIPYCFHNVYMEYFWNREIRFLILDNVLIIFEDYVPYEFRPVEGLFLIEGDCMVPEEFLNRHLNFEINKRLSIDRVDPNAINAESIGLLVKDIITNVNKSNILPSSIFCPPSSEMTIESFAFPDDDFIEPITDSCEGSAEDIQTTMNVIPIEGEDEELAVSNYEDKRNETKVSPHQQLIETKELSLENVENNANSIIAVKYNLYDTMCNGLKIWNKEIDQINRWCSGSEALRLSLFIKAPGEFQGELMKFSNHKKTTLSYIKSKNGITFIKRLMKENVDKNRIFCASNSELIEKNQGLQLTQTDT
jgi:hypothetical protein